MWDSAQGESQLQALLCGRKHITVSVAECRDLRVEDEDGEQGPPQAPVVQVGNGSGRQPAESRPHGRQREHQNEHERPDCVEQVARVERVADRRLLDGAGDARHVEAELRKVEPASHRVELWRPCEPDAAQIANNLGKPNEYADHSSKHLLLVSELVSVPLVHGKCEIDDHQIRCYGNAERPFEAGENPGEATRARPPRKRERGAVQ